jgi:predicted TIM-barrel fold metal-dependent hydrolase
MILDGHIHVMSLGTPNPHRLIEQMAQAGVVGGILLSLPPKSFTHQVPFLAEARLDNLMAWSCGHERLFPFFWIDPLADDALDQIRMACDLGVLGFKVICDRFFPHDARAMLVFQAIADAGRPILFHSGILWDGKPSSRFNRPAEFECLMAVRGLRFALAHIGWPWTDECLAVYGKLQDAAQRYPQGMGAEMFIDTTPGTPEIYRNDALSRLFRIGYDVAGHVFFGTDFLVDRYFPDKVQLLVNRDEQIFREMGMEGITVTPEDVFSRYLLRFVHGQGAYVSAYCLADRCRSMSKMEMAVC